MLANLFDENHLWVDTQVFEENDTEKIVIKNFTEVSLPEYEPGKFGFKDGSRPQFDPVTQTWKPYREPVVQTVERQLLLQQTLQISALQKQVKELTGNV